VLALNKSKLDCKSPKVWTWERCEKFLLMLTTVYTLLLRLLVQSLEPLCKACLRGGATVQESRAAMLHLRSTDYVRLSAIFWELTPARR